MSDLRHMFRYGFALAVVSLALVACGGKSPKKEPLDGGQEPVVGLDAGGDASLRGDSSTRDSAQPMGALMITPNGPLTVDSLAPQPITFSARLPDGTTSNVRLTWVVDPTDLGTIDPVTGVFTPTGAGGKLKVTVGAGTLFGVVAIDVIARATQDGDPDFGKLPTGAGGIGGVGGEGGGSMVTNTAVRTALDAAPTDDPTFQWLYPYDGTVWPRGLPAPLLQWARGDRVPVAVKLTVSVDTTFQATLYLGPPAGVTQIDRVPIPQLIWRRALQSGQTMKVALSYAASDGAGGYKSYKPTKELTWTIAPTILKGVVYYNSYGTKLAENFGGAMGGGNGRFGGATLAIEGGAFDPKLVAGSTTADSSGCRVCHSVASEGSTLIGLHDDPIRASVYDLKTSTERVAPATDNGKFGWSALYPDGTVALGGSGPPGIGQGNTASLDKSALYRVADGTTLTANGLAEVVTQATTPSFAPNGSKVVFNLYKGAGVAGAIATKSLVMMDVTRSDPNTFSFTGAKPIFTATGAEQIPGWPYFLPDLSGVVFELELKAGGYGEHLMTRDGARGELWWTDLQGNAHALDAANGEGHLPKGPLSHDDDTTLAFEPTVAPIVAGGYAWVVFTSRRLYGNVATRNPYDSDPRNHDLTAGNAAGPTTKKLWVSAISIPPKPGTDPSHPAFYLPAQELFAGNSRGFWTLKACKADGLPCDGGDECCGGYCTQGLEFPVCGNPPSMSCAKEYDKCNVTADCCGNQSSSLTCIAGRCAVTILL